MTTYQESLIQFAKGFTKKSKGTHYTLTPNHLYIHDKKKLHKSKLIWRFDAREFGLTACFSDDGGETWKLLFGDGFVMLTLSDVLKNS